MLLSEAKEILKNNGYRLNESDGEKIFILKVRIGNENWQIDSLWHSKENAMAYAKEQLDESEWSWKISEDKFMD